MDKMTTNMTIESIIKYQYNDYQFAGGNLLKKLHQALRDRIGDKAFFNYLRENAPNKGCFFIDGRRFDFINSVFEKVEEPTVSVLGGYILLSTEIVLRNKQTKDVIHFN